MRLRKAEMASVVLLKKYSDRRKGALVKVDTGSFEGSFY